ncbi:MAG: hypothetical protein ACLQBA_08115 [Candidatus Binataceae bacterium]
MGPTTLFDKSFLQSLSVDESVWFAHFFYPIICPLFYVETLADLEKAVREGRTPEDEVGIIAAKFPEASAAPCPHHMSLALSDLLGSPVPMTGQVPRDGGRAVEVEGKRAVVYDRSPTETAFSRWQEGKFLEIERENARRWRAGLQQVDLKEIAEKLKETGIDATNCRSLDHAYALARGMVEGTGKPWQRIALAVAVLGLPRDYEHHVVERWNIEGKKPLAVFAPYAAHVIACDLFFRFALASGHIGTSRPSNRVDIAYLNYLPFANIFVSSDTLHRRAAPQFLHPKQRFVWGPDLKADLARINTHFSEFPEEEKTRGIMAFAHAPPKRDGSLVRELRAQFMGTKYDDRPPIVLHDGEKEAEIVAEVNRFVDSAPLAEGRVPIDSAPFPQSGVPIAGDEDKESVVIQRTIRRKRGSWWQVAKDIDKKG